jgi:hypothetical protein
MLKAKLLVSSQQKNKNIGLLSHASVRMRASTYW